ncbi:rhodanese-like domain-containing protein [Halobacillus salinarum]|uniref:Rhodanese-like domain-containing protein n=1 Tax=Halobacillus salinarum TaxID=2932257 RepID=A0ABY4EPS9_9BACI|nr:rhodanese-like domain-containing protein [Halobacillus salinarum]UOQ46096.1 rhodanese-like domain-containing protein [Halobacillus salinarum]
MSDIRQIKPDELEKLIEKDAEIRVIDVREEEEVAQGMIPTAQHIPLGTIPETLQNLDPANEYVMVCRSGKRSMNASEYLMAHGFKNVHNLEGGMLKWNGELVF